MAKKCVIIVNWNNPYDTINCLKSLKNIKDLYVVLIDNGSTDGSVETISEVAKFDKLIVLPENLGFGRGNNVGISFAVENNFDYIWLLNNDTIVEEETLDHMLSIMENTKIGIVGSRLIYLEGKERGMIQTLGGGTLNRLTLTSKNIKIPSDIDKMDYITGASMLIRREVISSIGMFDERIFLYWEDVDISLRAIKKSWQIGYSADSVVYHKESATSRKLGKARQEYFTKGLYIMLLNNFSVPLLRFRFINALRFLKKLLQGNILEAFVIFRVGIISKKYET